MEGTAGRCSGWTFGVFLERELLLSRITSDLTVGIRRDKKQSGSTQ